MEGGGDRRGKGKEKERKWREKGEKVKVKKWMVNEVNGERGEFDEYDVCSEWQKGQKVKRSTVTLHKKTMGCWQVLEYCCWLVLEYSGSRFLLYIKGSTYARTLLYGFLILIIRIHFAFTFTLSTDSPNSPFTTFTFSLSLFHFCQMWLLTFWPFALFESSPMLSPAVPSEPQFQAIPSPVPFLSRCPFSYVAT